MIAVAGLACVVVPALPLALVAGTHAATWGAYKDSPYEGYHPLRQVRTIVVAVIAAVLGIVTGLVDPRAGLPAIGVIYTLERLATEWWKTILRVDDQTAYAIPMRLSFRGRPVDIDWIRYGCGALVLAALVGFGAAVHAAQQLVGVLPWWLVALVVGGLGGWMTAIGGAWKDAPVEGFSGWKFIRSPTVATAWALPLSVMTSSLVSLCLAAGGLAVFSIETYKTFWTGGRAPGKFADRPKRHSLPGVRLLMGLLHAGTWAMFAAIGLGGALNAMLFGFVASIVVSAGAVLVAGSVLLTSGRVSLSRGRVACSAEAEVTSPTAVPTR